MTNYIYNKVAEETNKYAALSQRKVETVDYNLEDTMRKKSKPILEF